MRQGAGVRWPAEGSQHIGTPDAQLLHAYAAAPTCEGVLLHGQCVGGDLHAYDLTPLLLLQRFAAGFKGREVPGVCGWR